MVTWSDRQCPRFPTVALPPKQAPVTLTPFQRPPRLPFPGRAGRQQPFSTTTPDWGRWLLWPRCAEPARRPPGGGLWWVGGSSATLACQGSFMSQPSPDPARASSWAGSRPLPQPLPAVFGVGLGSWRTAAGQGWGLVTAGSISWLEGGGGLGARLLLRPLSPSI